MPKEQVGVASGLFTMCSSVGAAMGITLAGTFLVLGSRVAESNPGAFAWFSAWERTEPEIQVLRAGSMLTLWGIAGMLLLAVLSTLLLISARRPAKG
ncbi:hypothetical protein JSY14_10390 [Brachybacterium sp. EF45031]|uniref:hypothetical protein n=1 Tax=Brachybacterium sillae TaxID=2810536 RepID=UPI00217DC5D1|nr:hypothetical protein [Brachybacterium sillae]MCS6712414.1 hypothetical protein [Brachybacterium sillae]